MFWDHGETLGIKEISSAVNESDDVVGNQIVSLSASKRYGAKIAIGLSATIRVDDENGQADRTLVMFVSDHGMPLPFAKTNCWRNSTKTPWIVRWPGVVKAGTVDREHFVSGIDFAPTILKATGLPPLEGMDGRSFLPLLEGSRPALPIRRDPDGGFCLPPAVLA